MWELLKELSARLSAGEDLALVPVVARSGSAPRGAGARMLVNGTGRVWGTVGGGLIEHRAECLALETLGTRETLLQEFSLDGGGAEQIGMVCGGDVTMAVQFLPAGDEALGRLVEEALSCLRSGGDGWVISRVDGPGQWLFLPPAEAAERFAPLAGCGEGQAFFTAEGAKWFAQRLARRGMVYLFGGGHVARELAPLLARLEFRYTVVDDRPELAQPQDFPGADRVLCADFSQILQAVSPTPVDYAAVMTRGHLFDLEVQKQLLTTPVGYIGVMGSRKKKAFVFQKLREAGFTDQDLSRIVTPIGLPLGGETPAEIALSIAAQLVQLRAGKGV